MMKKFTVIGLLLILNSFKGSANVHMLNGPDSDTAKVALKISPARPLIEKDIYGYYLNFDIIIKNQSTHTVELSAVEAAILDNKGKLSLRKFINSYGKTQGDLLVYTIIKPGETVKVFNPFHTFAPDLEIASLKYGFFFDYADTQQEIDNNKKRLPIDFDISVIRLITPQVYIAKNDYFLPLRGKIIVWDGHDFNSRNRRSTPDAMDPKVKEITSNSSRYAYDLMNVDANGSMYSGSPYKKENWYSYGKPVYVPLGGTIVSVQNSVPDNEYDGKTIKSPKIAPNMDPEGMGNYVIIQHANGEYSMLLHMEIGSIRVRPGQMVREGEEIGTVGFSGQAMYPHLHYSVTNGAKELASEGLPNYFNNYKLYRGNNVVNVKRSRIDSGDIVESEK